MRTINNTWLLKESLWAADERSISGHLLRA
jgi:hypothetical protein